MKKSFKDSGRYLTLSERKKLKESIKEEVHHNDEEIESEGMENVVDWLLNEEKIDPQLLEHALNNGLIKFVLNERTIKQLLLKEENVIKTLKERYESKKISLLSEDISRQNLELSSKYQRLLTKLSNFGIFKKEIPGWIDAIKGAFLSEKDLDPDQMKEKIFRGKAGQAISVLSQLESASKNFKPLIISILLNGEEEKFDTLDKKVALKQFPEKNKKTMFEKGLIKAFSEESTFRKVINFLKLQKADPKIMAKYVMELNVEQILAIENIFETNPPPDPTKLIRNTPPAASGGGGSGGGGSSAAPAASGGGGSGGGGSSAAPAASGGGGSGGGSSSAAPAASGGGGSEGSAPPAAKKDPEEIKKELFQQLISDLGLLKGKNGKKDSSLEAFTSSDQGKKLMQIIDLLQKRGLLKEALRRGAIKLAIINE
jgi:hypothetical protein